MFSDSINSINDSPKRKPPKLLQQLLDFHFENPFPFNIPGYGSPSMFIELVKLFLHGKDQDRSKNQESLQRKTILSRS